MSQLDVSDTIIAKSDQLNAVDLPPAETIVKIVDVKRSNSKEQPVSLHLEGHDGRPYKPCLSMRRILINAWGQYADQWINQSMALYRDDSVKWAGKEVGGIRIARLTGIDKTIYSPIALNRSMREMYAVDPLIIQEIDWKSIADNHVKSINACKTTDDLNACRQAVSKDRNDMPKEHLERIVAAGEAIKATFKTPDSSLTE